MSSGSTPEREAFHDLLVARGIPHEFHLYPGGHDWNYFAQHLPASLEFHSRAFSPAEKGRVAAARLRVETPVARFHLQESGARRIGSTS